MTMRRRDVLKGTAAAMLAPAARAAAAEMSVRITDLRLRRIRLVKDLGAIAPHEGNNNVDPRHYAIGGYPIIEVHTDQGLIGYGPGVALPPPVRPEAFAAIKAMIVGRDIFDMDRLAYELYGLPGGALVEVALWDLIGKAVNLPLYKLWGGARGRVMPYAAQTSLGTPDERARMALMVKAAGWRAIKLRAHFDTLKEDIRLVEAVRKAVGDDFIIICDANQAGNYPDGHGGGLRWDLTRAVDTANEYKRLGVRWLEEPLPRYDYDGLAELHRRTNLPIAGGEFNRGVHEYREYLERHCYDVLNSEVLQEGPTVMRQVAMLAQAFGKTVATHSGYRHLGTICSIHMTANWPNASLMEVLHEPPACDALAMWSVFENPPKLDKDGCFAAPDGPGLGMTYQPDLIVDG